VEAAQRESEIKVVAKGAGAPAKKSRRKPAA
jgi:hypothetical protein